MQKEENNLKINIYPPSVRRQNRNTYHYQSRIKIPMEDEELNERSNLTVFDKFLKILNNHPSDRRDSEINLIIQYLYLTEIIEKFKMDQDLLTHTNLKNIMEIFARNLKIQIFQCGEVLFKIDDVAEKVYIILKGAVAVLKPKPSTEVFTNKEYLSYLRELKEKNENFIMQEIINANCDLIPIKDSKHLDKIFLYFFKVKCRKALIEESIEKFRELFEKNKKGQSFTYKNFNIDVEKMVQLYDKYKFHSTRAHIETKNPWVEYVTERLNLTHKDILEYDRFREMYKNKEKKKLTIFNYHKFMYLCAGQYFGDMAFNTKSKRRNATIRAEEDTVVGYVEKDIYIKYIKSENLKIRARECQFINESFFGYAIASSSLEKYFSNFTPHSYLRGFEICKENSDFTHVVLVKDGEVELNFNGSVIDIYNLIKILVEKTTKYHKSNKTVSHLSEEDIVYLNSLIYDINLERSIDKSPEFINGINKKRTSYICLLPVRETFGIEEFFLNNVYYFCSAKVCSDAVKVIKIYNENLRTILTNENMTTNYFVKKSLNKIISLIKRLNHIKKTLCEKLLNDSFPGDNLLRNGKDNYTQIASGHIEILNRNMVLNQIDGKNLNPMKKSKRKIVYSYSSYNNEEIKHLNQSIINKSKLSKEKNDIPLSSTKDLKNDDNVIKSLKLSVKNFIDKSLHTYIIDNPKQNTNNQSRSMSIDKDSDLEKDGDMIKNSMIPNQKLSRLDYHSRTKSFNTVIEPPVSLVNLLGHDTQNNNKSVYFSNSNINSLYNIFNSSNLIPGISNPQYLPDQKKMYKANRLPKIDLRNIISNECGAENGFTENKSENTSLNKSSKMCNPANYDAKNDCKSNKNVGSTEPILEFLTPNYPSLASTRSPLHVNISTKQIEIPNYSTKKDPVSYRLNDSQNKIISLKALPVMRTKFKIKKKNLNE